jgi:cytochrome P450
MTRGQSGVSSASATANVSLDDALAGILRSDPEALRDPWPVWRAVREAGPVYHHGEVALVTRHNDVRALAKDPRLSSGYHAQGGRADAIWARLSETEREAQLAVARFESMYVVRSDGEMHTRLRSIMHRAFTPRRIAQLADQIEQFAAEILQELGEREQFDFVTEVGVRLPLMVITELLGVPQDHSASLHDWCGRLARNRGGEDPVMLMSAYDAILEFRDYVEQEVLPRRNELGGSELARAFVNAEQGDTLTPEETTAQFVVLLFAGFETTSNLMDTGLLELWRHPAQWQLLREEPARAEVAVEELLRWVTPAQWIGRAALEDVEIAGEVLPAGQTVYPCLAAANRDPDAFSEPERLDLLRDDVRMQLSFGLGQHFCLGSALARIEARALFEQLARHYPDLEVLDDDPPWGSNAMLRAIQRLPVRLGRRAGRPKPKGERH